MSRDQACNEQTLVLYHYGELTADDRRDLESHLEICSSCRASLNDLQASLAAIPQPQFRLDDAQKMQFVDQVAERTRRRSPRYLPVWGGALAAAALLVTILFLLPVGQPGSMPVAVPATADFEVLEQLELLQNFDLLEELDLLQEMEQLG